MHHQTQSTTEVANVERHKKAYALFSAHDPAMFELFHEEVVEGEGDERIDGKAALIAFNRAFWGGFSDLEVVVDRAWGAGDFTFLSGRLKGTNDGPFPPMGLDKTGRAIDVGFVEMVQWKGGLALRSYPVMEKELLAQQLGLAG